MTPMQGANADELDRLAGELSQSSKLVGGCQVQLSRQIHSSPWSGRSAEAFRRQWDSEFRRTLIDASAFLQEAGDVLRANADQQRQASGAGTVWTIDLTGIDVGPRGFDFGDIQELIDRYGLPALWNIYDLLTAIDDVSTLKDFFAGLAPEFSWLGFITGPISVWQGMDDLLNEQYDGWLGAIDTFGDVLQVESGVLAVVGTWMLIPPATPIGGAVLAAAAITGLTSAAINLGIEYREEIGEAWDATTDWAGDTWDSTTDWAGDTWDSTTDWAGDTWDSATDVAGDTWNATTDAVGDGWDTATDWAGSAWNAVF